MHKDRRGYAYETKREGGRVHRRYLGASPLVSLALELDQHKRQKVEAAKRQRQEEQLKERREILAPVALLEAQTKRLVEEWLQSAGFYRHRRGEWRKARRNTMSEAIQTQKKAQAGAAKLCQLRDLANAGDRDAAREFWEQMDAGATTPNGSDRAALVKQTGDLAALSLAHLLSKISDKNPLHEGALRRQLDTMREELTGAQTSPLEALLIERVLVCWLQLHYFEGCLALSLGEEVSMEEQLFRQKQADGANRRYLASIKALAQVRKLQLPALQINLAEKQINFG